MQAYLSAVLILAISTIVGQAIWSACGARRWSGLSPVIGLAAVISIAAITVRLPGDGATAAAFLLLATAIAATSLWGRRRELGRPPLESGGAALIALGLTAIPFVAAGRVGLLGMGLNNDTAVHLLFAEALRSDVMAHLYGIPATYPIGPHSLLAALADGTRIEMDPLMNGLVIAIPVFTAMAAVEGLGSAPRVLRVPGAVAVAFTYMLSAWFAQAAFKEPLFALFLLTFVLTAHEVLGRLSWDRRGGAVALAVLLAGAVQTYSYLALAWIGGTLAVAAALLVVINRAGPRLVLAEARRATGPLVTGALVSLVVLVVELPRLARFFDVFGTSPAGAGDGGIAVSNLGNLAGPLQLKEAFGIWPTGDFRFAPAADVITSQSSLQTLAMAAAVFGVLWCLRQREVVLPAAVATAVLIWKVSEAHQSPYVTAKALVILAPLVALVSMRALLSGWGAGRVHSVLGAGRWLVAAVLIFAFAWSSQLMLRAAPVESTEQRDDLLALRSTVKSGRTLFLGIDDYAGYRLRDVTVGYGGVGTPPPIPVTISADKPYTYTHALDFDSIAPKDLDTFRFVITVRSADASIAPSNFHRVDGNDLYDVWERRGPTPARTLLEQPNSAGAVLSCRGGKAARAAARSSRAVVWPAPPVGVPSGAVPPGGVLPVPLDLHRGVYDLSLQYTSAMPLRVEIGAKRVLLPANTTRPGPFWPLTRIRVARGLTTVYIVAERQSRLSSPLSLTGVSAVVATRVGPRPTVPVAQACGRYVDRLLP